MTTSIDFDISSELLAASETIDQSSVESNGVQYPGVWWNYGSPKQRKLGGMDYHGGWFVPGEQADLSGVEGWTKTSWTHDDGKETDGWFAPAIQIAVLRRRQRWEVRGSDNKRSLFPWKAYDAAKALGKASGRTHYMVMIKGLEDRGPFVLTLGGMRAVYFGGHGSNGRSALQRFEETVIKAANDSIAKGGGKSKMPYRAFWLNVGFERDEKGVPVFTESGSGNEKTSVCKMVAIGLPDKAANVNIKEFFVGQAALTKFNTLWTEAEAWATAWDDIKPGQAEEQATGSASTAAVTAKNSDIQASAEELGL